MLLYCENYLGEKRSICKYEERNIYMQESDNAESINPTPTPTPLQLQSQPNAMVHQMDMHQLQQQ